uniref:Uncharacterized protein n=1 Tax=Anguilla anguilla TaxID=7936 RepID=A0A0E9UZI4_ANGAN
MRWPSVSLRTFAEFVYRYLLVLF